MKRIRGWRYCILKNPPGGRKIRPTVGSLLQNSERNGAGVIYNMEEMSESVKRAHDNGLKLEKVDG